MSTADATRTKGPLSHHSESRRASSRLTLIPVTSLVTHPDFNPRTLANDLGVALPAAPAGITPVGLPPRGSARLDAGGGLALLVRDGQLRAVVDCSSKLCTFSIDGTRHVASAPVVAMIRDFVFVRNGVCAKGSGSPQLLPSGSTRRAPWGS